MEECKENIVYRLEGSMGVSKLAYVPLGSNTHQSMLEKSQPN
jgi:hypothetical protein